MKKLLLAASGMAAALMLASGCATVTYSSPRILDEVSIKGTDNKLGQLVFVDTTGFYLLWSLPIFSGDLRWDAQKRSIVGGTRIFTDMVDVESVQGALLNTAESLNCDLVDVTFHDSDVSFAEPSYFGLVGAFLGLSRISASAVLVPRAEPK